MKGIANLLPLVAIVGLMWLLIVRPSRARQRESLRTRERVSVGQHVLTTSGLHATVFGVEDDIVVLETSPGVTSRWAIGAIGRIVEAPEIASG